MKAFLREYWPWIVVPVAFVLVMGLLMLFFKLSGDEGVSPFEYKTF